MKADVQAIASDWHWRTLPALTKWVIEQALRIQQIPAPTFQEKERARFIATRFESFALDDISIDHVHNVFGRLPGKDSQTALLLFAHTDTVFPADTDLTATRRPSQIYGPGLGDNSLGVAAMLGLIKALRESPHTPDCDIWFVADACEEGLGNLRGAIAAFERLRPRISAVINLEGLALGHIYNVGIAVHRLRITANTDGGHSWLHHGRPSATHSIVSLGSQIIALDLPTHPRTTCSIGLIDGGQAINAIATKASLSLDLRSTSPEALDQLRHRITQLTAKHHSEDLRWTIETIGQRKAGSIPAHHPLVQGALTALSESGINGRLEAGSTDANVPLSHGCPAITIGITRGGNAHRLDEYIELPPIPSGLKQLIILSLAAARYYARQSARPSD